MEKGVIYPFTYVSCMQDRIIGKVEDEVVEVKLFNIEQQNTDVYDIACAYIQNATDVQIQIDPMGQLVNELSAYVIVDNKLLQKILLDEGHIEVAIANPRYMYYSMLYEELEVVSGEIEEGVNQRYYDRTRANQVLLLLFSLCVVSAIVVLFAFLKNVKNCN